MTAMCYEYLSDYKVGGYKCKSDYLAIIRWVHDAVIKKMDKLKGIDKLKQATYDALNKLQNGESNTTLF